MPLLGLGTYQLQASHLESVTQALEAGYSMIDTSGDYHTQRGIGEALRHCGLPRESIFLVTKIEETDDAFEATRANLAELRLDTQISCSSIARRSAASAKCCGRACGAPSATAWLRDIGVCNYSIEQIEELVYRTGELPAVNQIEWSPFGHSPRMLDFCHRQRHRHPGLESADARRSASTTTSSLRHGGALRQDAGAAVDPLESAARRGAAAQGEPRAASARKSRTCSTSRSGRWTWSSCARSTSTTRRWASCPTSERATPARASRRRGSHWLPRRRARDAAPRCAPRSRGPGQIRRCRDSGWYRAA